MDKGTETVNNTLCSETHAGVRAIPQVSWTESCEWAGLTPWMFHQTVMEGGQVAARSSALTQRCPPHTGRGLGETGWPHINLATMKSSNPDPFPPFQYPIPLFRQRETAWEGRETLFGTQPRRRYARRCI